MAKKFISLTLIFTLLMNTVSTGFAQEYKLNKKDQAVLMAEVEEILVNDIITQGEDVAKEKSLEASKILDELRVERLQGIEAGRKERIENSNRFTYNENADKFKEEVQEMLAVLYPFRGMDSGYKFAGYRDSKYFKEEGSLYRYLLESRLLYSIRNSIAGAANDDGLLVSYGTLSKQEIKGVSELEIRNMFIMGSKDEAAQKVELEKRGHAVDSVLMMLAYYESLGDGACWKKEGLPREKFKREEYEECPGCMEEDCPTCKSIEEAVEVALKEDIVAVGCKKTADYEEANEIFKIRRQEIEKYAEISSVGAGRCVAEVLMPLQASFEDIAFGEIREYVKAKGEKLEWGLCGLSKEEGEELILAGVMSEKEADKEARKVQVPDNFFEMAFLDSWKYLSPTHYINRAERIGKIERRYPEEVKGLDGNAINRAGIRGGFLANSLNENLYQIASGLLAYGMIFEYIPGLYKLGATEFGKELYSIATGGEPYLGEWSGKSLSYHNYYMHLPISGLGRHIIMYTEEFKNISGSEAGLTSKHLYEVQEEVDYAKDLKDMGDTWGGILDFGVSWLAFSGIVKIFTGMAKVLKVGNIVTSMMKQVSLGRKTLKGFEAAGKAFRAGKLHFSNWLGEVLRVPGYGEAYWKGISKIEIVANKATVATSNIRYMEVTPGQMPQVTDTRVEGILKGNEASRGLISNPEGRLITQVKPHGWNPKFLEVEMDGKVFSYNTNTMQFTETGTSLASGDARQLTTVVGEGGGSGGAANAFDKIRRTNGLRGGARRGIKIGNGKGSYFIPSKRGAIYETQIKVFEEERIAALNTPQESKGFFSLINKPRSEMTLMEKFRNGGALFEIRLAEGWDITKGVMASLKNPFRASATLGTFGVGGAPTVTAVIEKAPVEIVANTTRASETFNAFEHGFSLYDPKQIAGNIPLPRANNWAPSMTPLFSMPKLNIGKVAPFASLRILPTDPLLIRQQKFQFRREIAGLAAATIAGISLVGAIPATLGSASLLGTTLFALAPIITPARIEPTQVNPYATYENVATYGTIETNLTKKDRKALEKTASKLGISQTTIKDSSDVNLQLLVRLPINFAYD